MLKYRMIFKRLILLSLFTLIAFPSLAMAQYEVKDSYYYMKDDGEFSDEEKDLEAQYVYERCESNSIQNVYYDCACIAGAFRQIRDEGKLMPQTTIVNSLFRDDPRGCTNTEKIAGQTYNFCTEYSKSFRYREKPESNEAFCGCVANTMANNFAKTPSLNLDIISSIRTNALVSCNRS